MLLTLLSDKDLPITVVCKLIWTFEQDEWIFHFTRSLFNFLSSATGIVLHLWSCKESALRGNSTSLVQNFRFFFSSFKYVDCSTKVISGYSNPFQSFLLVEHTAAASRKRLSTRHAQSLLRVETMSEIATWKPYRKWVSKRCRKNISKPCQNRL